MRKPSAGVARCRCCWLGQSRQRRDGPATPACAGYLSAPACASGAGKCGTHRQAQTGSLACGSIHGKRRGHILECPQGRSADADVAQPHVGIHGERRGHNDPVCSNRHSVFGGERAAATKSPGARGVRHPNLPGGVCAVPPTAVEYPAWRGRDFAERGTASRHGGRSHFGQNRRTEAAPILCMQRPARRLQK